MRRVLLAVGGLVSLVVAAVVAFRRNRRVGTRLMNECVNRWLLERGLPGAARSEIGTIEHVGRRSGTRRLTPVRPVRTDRGFRIMVPVGSRSEWARNVMAAGHCRMELAGEVYELDEPEFVLPRTMEELSQPVRLVGAALGFMYLRLHTFAHQPGSLLASVGAEASGSSDGAMDAEPEPITEGPVPVV